MPQLLPCPFQFIQWCISAVEGMLNQKISKWLLFGMGSEGRNFWFWSVSTHICSIMLGLTLQTTSFIQDWDSVSCVEDWSILGCDVLYGQVVPHVSFLGSSSPSRVHIPENFNLRLLWFCVSLTSLLWITFCTHHFLQLYMQKVCSCEENNR